MMKRYQTYNVEELAMDDWFRSWILMPTEENSTFWKVWLVENVDKQDIVNQAGELVLAIHELYKDDFSEELISEEILEISRLAEISKSKKTGFLPSINLFWKIAAVFLVITGLVWLFYFKTENIKTQFATTSLAYNEDATFVKTNQTSSDLTILLSDNSVVTLTKGSTLTYPTSFEKSERKVILTGEAFFDISKDPAKPFLVYTNETVTKVLGTSFRVKAFDKDKTVMVFVKTGKVSVYPKNEYETHVSKNEEKISGVVLSPNQQVVFIRNQNRLEKGRVDNPAMLYESSLNKELIFDDKPVADVLHTLERIYGIIIVFDPETLHECVISAQFNEENLKQRMNAICQAIGASYEMVDGHIVISSRGCLEF